MKRQETGRRRLKVSRETLRSLTTDDLERVQGGAKIRNNCTGRLSGCIAPPYSSLCAE